MIRNPTQIYASGFRPWGLPTGGRPQPIYLSRCRRGLRNLADGIDSSSSSQNCGNGCVAVCSKPVTLSSGIYPPLGGAQESGQAHPASACSTSPMTYPVSTSTPMTISTNTNFFFIFSSDEAYTMDSGYTASNILPLPVEYLR